MDNIDSDVVDGENTNFPGPAEGEIDVTYVSNKVSVEYLKQVIFHQELDDVVDGLDDVNIDQMVGDSEQIDFVIADKPDLKNLTQFSPALSTMTPKYTPSTEYDFNHPKRGFALIFNNIDFENEALKRRNGADVDATNLFSVLNKLQFDVRIFVNYRVNEIDEIVKLFSEANHDDADCFACFVMSHGIQDMVHATDDLIFLENLAEPFKKCPSLIGKPKLFVIQACRGLNMDSGAAVADAASTGDNQHCTDEGAAIKVPRESDFLWVFATPPGYVSWRNSTKGSWFIQAFVRAVNKFGQTKNFLHILAYVNHTCAHEFQTNSSQIERDGKKQSSNYTSRLTKDIYFRPK